MISAEPPVGAQLSSVEILNRLVVHAQTFEQCMLVVNDGQKVQVHPYPVLSVEPSGTVTLLGTPDAAFSQVLQKASRLQLVFQSKALQVCLAGTATLIPAVSQIDTLWKASLAPWFPSGKATEGLALILMVPSEGEFWDQTDTSGSVRFWAVAAQAALTDYPVTPDPLAHGKVTLPA